MTTEEVKQPRVIGLYERVRQGGRWAVICLRSRLFKLLLSRPSLEIDNLAAVVLPELQFRGEMLWVS